MSFFFLYVILFFFEISFIFKIKKVKGERILQNNYQKK